MTRSSAKAEYRATTESTRGTKLLEKNHMSLFCDNKVAISIAHNPVQHDRMKIYHHFITEKVSHAMLSILHVTSDNQLANLLIEGPSTKHFHTLIFSQRISRPQFCN